MEANDNREQRLWDYIDGISSAGERSAIEKLLQENAEWKAKYNELLEVKSLLSSSELDAPSMRFTKNVMEEVAKLSMAGTKRYLNSKIIWGIGIFFIAMLVGFLVYGFSQMSLTDTGSTYGISKKIPTFDLSRFFSNTWVNVMMMINVVIGLFLLDSYLTRKKEQYKKEA